MLFYSVTVSRHIFYIVLKRSPIFNISIIFISILAVSIIFKTCFCPISLMTNLTESEIHITYLTWGISRTLIVMSRASGVNFSTCSRTSQKSRLSRIIPFFAAQKITRNLISLQCLQTHLSRQFLTAQDCNRIIIICEIGVTLTSSFIAAWTSWYQFAN